MTLPNHERMNGNGIVHSERVNAVIGWILILAIVVGAIANILAGMLLWGGLVLVIAVVASVPAIVTGSKTAMVPWPLLTLAVLAIFARLLGPQGETASYLTIAALALIAVIELDVFTRVELSRRFAVIFGVLMTMAIESVWIVARYFSDLWLDTSFLRSQTALQWDIVATTAVAFTVGILYQWYATRFEPPGAVTVASNRETQ